MDTALAGEACLEATPTSDLRPWGFEIACFFRLVLLAGQGEYEFPESLTMAQRRSMPEANDLRIQGSKASG
jgi:hypothetical protein